MKKNAISVNSKGQHGKSTCEAAHFQGRWSVGMVDMLMVGLLIFVFFIGVFTTQALYKMDYLQPYNPVELHWACMDGCYNMLIIRNFTNTVTMTAKETHEKCSNMCWDMYMVGD